MSLSCQSSAASVTGMPLNEHRQLLALHPDELEDLVKKWIARVFRGGGEYVGFERPTASADMGRDAVGFLSEHRYEGEWHNYQCKHLKAPIKLKDFTVELGKVFHYACAGEFTLPSRYIFVAPNAAVREVKKLIDLPSSIATHLLAKWDQYCLSGVSTTPTPLTEEIRLAISTYNFARVELLKATELVELPDMRAVMSDVMDIDPGAAPVIDLADVPSTVGLSERPYVDQLVKVFGSHRGCEFADHSELSADQTYGPRLVDERRRYLEHRAFRRHFRDNLPDRDIDAVDDDIRSGVEYHYHNMASAPLHERLTTVMGQAAAVEVSGPLGRHRRVTTRVKQGACHHFANKGDLPWA